MGKLKKITIIFDITCPVIVETPFIAIKASYNNL